MADDKDPMDELNEIGGAVQDEGALLAYRLQKLKEQPGNENHPFQWCNTALEMHEHTLTTQGEESFRQGLFSYVRKANSSYPTAPAWVESMVKAVKAKDEQEVDALNTELICGFRPLKPL